MERVWEPDDTGNDAFGRPFAPDITHDSRNLDFDVVYIDYTSPNVKFQIGYQPDYTWGTIWANRTTDRLPARLNTSCRSDPLCCCRYAKEDENDLTAQYPGTVATEKIRILTASARFSNSRETMHPVKQAFCSPMIRSSV
jgi:hypothetical protein